MIQVKREKRKPSNTPNRVRMKASGPGIRASQPTEGCDGMFFREILQWTPQIKIFERGLTAHRTPVVMAVLKGVTIDVRTFKVSNGTFVKEESD